jgi:Uma2 family endonuclease
MFSTEEPAELPVWIVDDDGGGSWHWDPPEIELIDGRPVRKVSPRRRHARVQLKLASLFDAWGEANGFDVGTEWRFHLSAMNSYLPDLAAVETARLRGLRGEALEEPRFAPDVAVEIRSPNNRATDIALKIARYLEFGGKLVLDVDPALRTVVAHDAGGQTRFVDHTFFEHPLTPGLRIDLAAVFAAGDPPA